MKMSFDETTDRFGRGGGSGANSSRRTRRHSGEDGLELQGPLNSDNEALLGSREYTCKEVESDGDGEGSKEAQLGAAKIIILNMTYMGLNMMLLLLSVEVVPAQIEIMVGSATKGTVLGVTVALGAVLQFIIGPLVGMYSDRLTSSYGRRKPIIIVAVIIFCMSCLIMVSIAPPINNQPPSFNSSQCLRANLTERRCKNVWTQTKHLTTAAVVAPETQSIMQQQPPELGQKTQPAKRPVLSNRIFVYVPAYLIVISAYVAAITPYNAFIADKSRPSQRGLSSGSMGGMILLGNIFGAGLGLMIAPTGAVLTVSVGLVILIVCVVVTMTQIPETPLSKASLDAAPLSCYDKMKNFIRPLKDHDFRWLFITRFLMQQALTSWVGFMEYWVADMIPIPLCWSTYKAVSYLLLPTLLFAALSSIISGIISDRTGRRKLILIIASIVMGSMALAMAFIRGDVYYVVMVLAIIYGIALGGYQAVDFALLMDILPSEKDKSLMIAVWHQAMVLPQALAVPVAGIIVDLLERVNCRIGLGYSVLMVVIAIYFLLGGCFITRIRGAT